MLGIRTVGDLLFSTCKALGLTSETEKKNTYMFTSCIKRCCWPTGPPALTMNSLNCPMLTVTC